jgi:hypothetical protein
MKIQVQAADESLKPRVAAVARDAAEVVRFAGGWLFDQAMAGWDVNVLTLEDGDLQSLRILGAHAHDLAPVLQARGAAGKCLHAIAIPADLYRSDPGVRKIASRALESAPGELLLWGDDVPADLGPEPGLRRRLRRAPMPVQYRLSFAARAFKAQALAAAQLCDPGTVVAEAESFVSVK